MEKYLTIDIGAESGRLILGSVDKETFSLKEIYRFPNGMLQMNGRFFWNIGQLFKEILIGLERCISVEKTIPVSIGIDTWGVDYGLLAEDGYLMGLPYTYRDPRTNKAIKEFTELMPPDELYNLTGTLLAPYNTLFQLFAAKKSHPKLLQSASDLLFIPDLLTYFLTGIKKTERSFATTSQLYNPIKNEWEKQLFDILGISAGLMQEVIQPETIIGYLDKNICKQTGMPAIPVIAVATHDTNSAVSAIPAKGDNWAFISSGTWSLMGFENPEPLINSNSYRMNFTNEGGLRDTWHILKNHIGLWPLQECRRAWKTKNYSYEQLVKIAREAEPLNSYIDIDFPGFLNPVDMPAAIDNYLKQSNQKLPESHAQVTRLILESLALKYRNTLEEIEILKGKKISELYITGGGIHNELLCQFTANATGITVHTALAEGTAAGNIMCQALAMKQFCSVEEIRMLIGKNCNLKTFSPQDTAHWENAYFRFKKVINNQH